MSNRTYFEKETKGNSEMAYWCIQLEIIPISVAWSNQELCYSPLEEKLAHCNI